MGVAQPEQKILWVIHCYKAVAPLEQNGVCVSSKANPFIALFHN